jgi:hypothetical protein
MLPNALCIPRPGQINAWDNDDFVTAVKATGRRQLIIVGVVTDVCVSFPTLSASQDGYEVFVATEASGRFNPAVWEADQTGVANAGAYRNLMTSYAAKKKSPGRPLTPLATSEVPGDRALNRADSGACPCHPTTMARCLSNGGVPVMDS